MYYALTAVMSFFAGAWFILYIIRKSGVFTFIIADEPESDAAPGDGSDIA